MIVILNLNTGNLEALKNAVEECGFTSKICSPDSVPEDYSHLILPGVGSYNSTMQSLVTKKYVKSILNLIQSGKPVLGICLGMQILSSFGNEPNRIKGLNLIEGNVSELITGQPLPHVGWNEIEIKKTHPILEGIVSKSDFYFVHSMSFKLKFKTNEIAQTHYDQNFTSIVAKKNIFAVQFHPEKSQKKGLRLLKNFCNWNGF
tara:strand:- start:146 stop:754 length:609 start_codon:yes stop_codon:yes gene_type:complete